MAAALEARRLGPALPAAHGSGKLSQGLSFWDLASLFHEADNTAGSATLWALLT